jgi:hypothetical protein
MNEIGEEGEEGLHGELHFEMLSVRNGLDDMYFFLKRERGLEIRGLGP